MNNKMTQLDKLKVATQERFRIASLNNTLNEQTTCGHLVEMICKQIEFDASAPSKMDEINSSLKSVLQDFLSEKKEVNDDTPVFHLIDISDHEIWRAIGIETNLEIPRPFLRGLFAKLKGEKSVTASKHIDCTFSDFIRAVCAANHSVIFERPTLKNRFEVECIIIGQIAELSGTDVYDISSDYKLENLNYLEEDPE